MRIPDSFCYFAPKNVKSLDSCNQNARCLSHCQAFGRILVLLALGAVILVVSKEFIDCKKLLQRSFKGRRRVLTLRQRQIESKSFIKCVTCVGALLAFYLRTEFPAKNLKKGRINLSFDHV